MIGRIFSRPRRDIFAFKENGRKRSADPLIVRRELDKANPEWLSLTQSLDTTPAKKMELPTADLAGVLRSSDSALQELCRCARIAFGVKAYDGTEGMTEAETITLLAEFIKWMTEAGESASFFPLSRPSTDRPPSENSTIEPSAE